MFHSVKETVLILALMLFTASVTFADKFVSTWKAPDAQPVDFAGKKVVVLVVSENRAARRAAEDALAKSITARGGQGVAAYTVIPESEMKDREKVKELLQEAGAAGIVVIKGTTRHKVELGPENFKDPQYKSFWGSYGQGLTDESANKTKAIDLLVETKVYSLDQDTLIWIGTSKTKTTKIDEFLVELAGAVAEEMSKVGLLKK